MKAWISIVMIVWPIIIKLARLKGIELPDIGDTAGDMSQAIGAGLLASSDPIGKKK